MAAPRNSFWSTLTRFDTTRLAPVMALRNAIGMAVPLAAGVLAGNPAAGVMAASGALNVAFSDGADPYRQRARRMLAAACLVSMAVFTGRYYGHNHALAILLAAVCALAAGLTAAIGQTPADIGTVTLVTLIVFSGSPTSFGKALSSCLLALAGGVLQTAFSLALWPVRRYGPERAALGALYAELARSAAAGGLATESPPATAAILAARAALANLAGDHSVQAVRYLALFGQAERIRLSLLTLSRLRTRIAREPGEEADAAMLGRALQIASRTLAAIGAALTSGVKGEPCAETFRDLVGTAPASARLAAMRNDARWHLDALAGQLRSATELAAHTTPAGAQEFERREAVQPWTLRLANNFAVLRANLNLNSAAFRDALRLAVCVAAADILARSMGWQRAYWAPMTLALVLKPDFTTTFSRGVLRLSGTFAGLGLATALSRELSPSQGVQAALITTFFFLMRWAGGANYGVLVTALTALLVFLFALSGVAPADVIKARALNTVAGGVIALAAYRLWPTWERSQISEALAGLLDAYRDYFQAICDAYLHPGLEREPQVAARLSQARQACRLVRTNLEASAARLSTEPGVDAARLMALEVIMANSHRFIHAVMALEAGLYSSRPVPARHKFGDFANAVDTALYFLSAYLRGSSVQPGDLPDLRQAHQALLESGNPQADRYALVNIETDRITNSVNTLAVEILHWVGNST